MASIAGITVLVWAVIEGPAHGWLSTTSIFAFGLAASLLAGFVWWERRIDHPMLDVSVFTNLRFTAGSVAVTFAFFALFGFVFVVTQYFQFVRVWRAGGRYPYRSLRRVHGVDGTARRQAGRAHPGPRPS